MIETRNLPFTVEVREMLAAGIAAPFNSNSHQLGDFVERILPGAFARSLAEAARGEINIHALWAHDSAQPLGSTRSGKLKLTEVDAGLAFELDATRMTELMRGALEDGDTQMSFGFHTREDKWLQLDDGTYERTLIDVDLREISFVINPAYPATDAALRSRDAWQLAQRQIENIDTTEQLKRVLFLRTRLNLRD